MKLPTYLSVNSAPCLLLAGVMLFAMQKRCLAEPDASYLHHDRARPQPPVVIPATPSTQGQAGKAPSDAIVLFDGKDILQWVSMDGTSAKWTARDGYMESVTNSGDIRTLQNFGDCQLHVEWAAPAPAKGEGQGPWKQRGILWPSPI